MRLQWSAVFFLSAREGGREAPRRALLFTLRAAGNGPSAFQVIFYHLLPGGWLTLLLKIYGSAGALALFFTRAQAPQGPEEEVEPHG